jgi:hypothetical protein
VAAPPPCASCHTQQRKPAGLHASKGHATCASCHRSHEQAPRDDRASCTTSCHVDKQAHEPSAVRCATCHPFKK